MKTSLAIISLFALTSTASFIPRHFFESGDLHKPAVSFPSGPTLGSHQWGNATNTDNGPPPSTKIPENFESNTCITAVPSPTNWSFVSETNNTLTGSTAVGNKKISIFEPEESFPNSLKTNFQETHKTTGDADTDITTTTVVTVTVSSAKSTITTKSSFYPTQAQKITTTSKSSSTSKSGPTSISASSTKTSSSAKSTSSTAKRTGRGTYYSPSSGACEIDGSESDYVVAIGEGLYDSLGVNNEEVSTACGKYITASYEGKSVKVKVVDSCASCSDNDIDFSPAAFKELADLSVGELQVEWSFD